MPQAVNLEGCRFVAVVTQGAAIRARAVTPHGDAGLALDFPDPASVRLVCELPSGVAYQSEIFSWAGGPVDMETAEGRASIARLALGFVLQAFAQEKQSIN